VRNNIQIDQDNNESFSNTEFQERANATTLEEPLKILNVHQYFQDFDLNCIDDSLDGIKEVRKYAEMFEDRINNFNESQDSVSYFVLDEKLMRLIEKLDRMKCHDEVEASKEKIETINYIKNLQNILDQRSCSE